MEEKVDGMEAEGDEVGSVQGRSIPGSEGFGSFLD